VSLQRSTQSRRGIRFAGIPATDSPNVLGGLVRRERFA
jgi:hypothetical protein